MLSHILKLLSMFLISDPQNVCPLQFRSLRKGLQLRTVEKLLDVIHCGVFVLLAEFHDCNLCHTISPQLIHLQI